MASHTERPTLDLAAGRDVLSEDLPRVLRSLGVNAIDQLGWRKPDARTLLIPVYGSRGDATDEYLLRLKFLTGRDWPPSAQFVNPDTLDYRIPDDFHHLPIVQSPEVHVHTTYPSPHSGPIQLICCSATFEYYDVLHGGEARHLWKPHDNFYLTVSAIERAMGSAYHGRQSRHGG